MKRLFVLVVVFTLTWSMALPGEGMWLPLLLEKYNIEEMQQKGFRLTAEDIYDINKISMKDAVVRIGGCTGVVVSESGLVLTNHHCAYRSIQSHSSVEDDYLTDGFWAMSEDEELPNPGLTVTFLVRMEDVTERVHSVLNDEMTEDQRSASITRISEIIKKEAVEGTRYRADVNAFYYGDEFYLFVYDVFNDVRLVGAPPSSIGKFGGDTDNWMWPRHTGDFAFFRIYADDENLPSVYDEENIPYQSPAFLPVSTRGIDEGDFTMVFGFPGTTSQYLTSHAVRIITNLRNPHKIRLRDERLAIMDSYMEQSDTVRIKYASKYAGVSNAWKKWQGENLGLARLDAVERKKKIEERFAEWVGRSQANRENYAHVLPSFDSLYNELERYVLPVDYRREALYAIETLRFVRDFTRLTNVYVADDEDSDLPGLTGLLKTLTDDFFKDYHHPLDREVFIKMLQVYYDNIDKEFYPRFFSTVENQFDSDFSLYAEHVFNESVFTNHQEVLDLINRLDDGGLEEIEEDIFKEIADNVDSVYYSQVTQVYNHLNDQLDILYRRYVQGLRRMEPDSAFYPDANRTLRVAYGQVEGYYPRDAVYYDEYTTLSGVIEKNVTGAQEYEVPSRLVDIYEAKNYGPWDVNGEMRTAFIASNHTSGGNSGSPVINGDGHLIGVNFDRVWEGTMSDIMFDPERCRNISVDINYVLFITSRFAGADHLLEEMTIVD